MVCSDIIRRDWVVRRPDRVIREKSLVACLLRNTAVSWLPSRGWRPGGVSPPLVERANYPSTIADEAAGALATSSIAEGAMDSLRPAWTSRSRQSGMSATKNGPFEPDSAFMIRSIFLLRALMGRTTRCVAVRDGGFLGVTRAIAQNDCPASERASHIVRRDPALQALQLRGAPLSMWMKPERS